MYGTWAKNRIWEACDQGDLEYLKSIGASHRHQIDLRNGTFKSTPAFVAAVGGHDLIIRKLASLGCKTLNTENSNGHTPFSIAAYCGYASTMKTLYDLHCGVPTSIFCDLDIDHQCKKGQTPMHAAAKRGYLDCVKLLHQWNSCAFDVKTTAGYTPLAIAAKHGQVEVVEFLLQTNNTVVDIANNKQRTPLLYAAKYGHDEILRSLVRFGSETIDQPDKYKVTPLHFAALYKRRSTVELLVQLGSKMLETKEHEYPEGIFMYKDIKQLPCILTLRALGVNCPQVEIWDKHRREYDLSDVNVEEDETWEVRYRVYFQQSLVDRLLFASDRNLHAVQKRQFHTD
ncbi:MAG: hypothetical protein BVN35_17690 [Proteobacteria bacterium ST_bin11]|nr:MAG: hypothetical protein BVN35_17690 [Proteobacteria bacterium ST_bin11]